MTALKIETPRWALPLLEKARYKCAWGGRGSGKSFFFAESIVEAHVMNPHTSTLCVREVQKSLTQSVKRLIEDRIDALGAGDYFDIKHDEIRMRRGPGRILFMGMSNTSAETIKSLTDIDRAWVEEAQVLSQTSLDLLRPTIRNEDSEIWFSWNPRSATDPVDAFFRSDPPPSDAIVVKVNWDQNPWFPQVLQDEMERDYSRDAARARHTWEGEYLEQTEAAVFRNWTIEEFVAPKNADFRFGADWGFSVDPTCLVRSYLDGRTLYVDYEAYQVGCSIQDTPSLFLTVPESEKWPIVSDSARPETIDYLRKNGFPRMIPALKGAGSVEDGIAWLQSHDIVVHPRCEHLIHELKVYSYRTDKLTNDVLPVLEDKNNHLIDALRYACESVRRLKKRRFEPIDYGARGLNAGIV